MVVTMFKFLKENFSIMKLLQLSVVLLVTFCGVNASDKPDSLTTSAYIVNEHGQYIYWTDENATKMYAAERASGSGCCTPTPPECHLDSNQEFDLTCFISDPSKLYEQHFSVTEQEEMLGVEGEIFFDGVHAAFLIKRAVIRGRQNTAVTNDRKRKLGEGN